VNVLDSVPLMCAQVLLIAVPAWVILVWVMDKIRDGFNSI
jgi:hypothetical protein